MIARTGEDSLKDDYPPVTAFLRDPRSLYPYVLGYRGVFHPRALAPGPDES